MFIDVDWVITGVGAKNGSSKIPFFRARRVITDSLSFGEMEISNILETSAYIWSNQLKKHGASPEVEF